MGDFPPRSSMGTRPGPVFSPESQDYPPTQEEYTQEVFKEGISDEARAVCRTEAWPKREDHRATRNTDDTNEREMVRHRLSDLKQTDRKRYLKVCPINN